MQQVQIIGIGLGSNPLPLYGILTRAGPPLSRLGSMSRTAIPSTATAKGAKVGPRRPKNFAVSKSGGDAQKLDL